MKILLSKNDIRKIIEISIHDNSLDKINQTMDKIELSFRDYSKVVLGETKMGSIRNTGQYYKQQVFNLELNFYNRLIEKLELAIDQTEITIDKLLSTIESISQPYQHPSCRA